MLTIGERRCTLGAVGEDGASMGAGSRTARFGLGIAVLSGCALAAGTPAYATAEVVTDRIAGADRYDTTAKVSQRVGVAPTLDVVLARGDLPFDALSGAGLAGALNTGILLTSPGALPAATATELARYGSPADVEVHVLGGTASVSAGIRSQLRAQGYSLVEYIGANRYDTAAKVKDAIDDLRRFGGLADAPDVFMVSGLSAADALSIGSVAYFYAIPIVLTEKAVLPGPSTEAVGSADVVIIGGLGAVSAAVSEQVQEVNGAGTVERLQGSNRFATATAVAVALGGTSGALLVRGDGTNFADALVASTYAGSRPTRLPVPILLTGGPGVADLPSATQSWLAAAADDISSVTAVGGAAAISDAALAAAARAAGAPG